MSTNTEPITGGCLCQAIRYVINAPPRAVGYCHCRRCQQAVGNIFGTAAIVDRKTLQVVKGQPKSFQSSATLARLFCGDCGSPLFAQHSDRDYAAVWIGTFDHPSEHPATVYWYDHDKIDWAPFAPGLVNDSLNLK